MDNRLHKKIIASIRNNRQLILIILINLAVTIYIGLQLNVWIDEAYSLHTTSGSFSYMISQSLNFENQPPVYFILLWLWRLFDHSYLFARLFSILCISFSITGAYFAAKRYLPNIQPYLITIVVAFNPFSIWAATEIRLYALIILESVLILIVFHDAYILENKSGIKRIIYIILAVVGIYTQYYLGFLLFANAVLLVYFRKWRSLRNYIVDMVIPVLSLFAFVPLVLSQLNTHSKYAEYESGNKIIEGIRFSVLKVYKYILPYNEYSFTRLLRWGIRIFLLLFLLIPFYKKRTRLTWLLKRNQKSLLIPVIIILCFFSLVYFVMGEFFIQDKHTAILFIPALILFYSLISLIPLKKYIVTWTLILILANIAAIAKDYSTLSKHYDTQKAAEYIQEYEKKSQPIIIYRNEVALPFNIHYNGINKIFPIPFGIDFGESYSVAKWALKDSEDVINAFNKIKINYSSAWLITTKNNYVYNINYHNELLENYINKNFTVLSEKKFPVGLIVRLIQKKGFFAKNK